MFTRNAVPALTFLWSLAAIVIGLTVLQGCQTDTLNGPVGPNSTQFATSKQMSSAAISLSCASDTATLYPNQGPQIGPPLGLASFIKFSSNTVSAPVFVTFTVCDMDTAGTKFLPKSYTLDPPGTTYLQSAKIYAKYSDLGGKNPTVPNIYKQIGPNTWQYVGVSSGGGAEYFVIINQGGTYALGYYGTSTVTTGSGSKVIGAAGDTLSLSSSMLIVPPRALLSNTPVSMTLKDTMFAPGSTGFTVANGSVAASPTFLPKLYIFGPDGTQFNVKAVLHVAFADAGFDGVNPGAVRFYYQDPVLQKWVAQETEYDLTNQEFIVYLQHFSRYCFIRY
jgi:hypothetical protein